MVLNFKKDDKWVRIPYLSYENLPDAPSDGNQYARQNNEWTVINIPDTSNLATKEELSTKINIDDTLESSHLETSYLDSNNDSLKLLTKKYDVVTKFFKAPNEGIVKISLPGTWETLQMNMQITLQQNVNSKTFTKFYVYGEIIKSYGQWTNGHLNCIGYPIQVLLAHDGTNCCVVLGNTSINLGNVSVIIDNIYISNLGSDNIWNGNFNIEIIPDTTSITNIYQPRINGTMTVEAARKFVTPRKIQGINFDGTADITLPTVTTTVDGIMSAQDKTNLDNVVTELLGVSDSLTELETNLL